MLRGVNIALEREPLEVCARLDRDHDGAIDVSDLVVAVKEALLGC